MKVGIIGAGNMGSAFARRLAAAGHDVAITSRDPGDAEKVARTAAGSTRVVPQQEIGGNVDVLIAATPFPIAAAGCQAARSNHACAQSAGHSSDPL